MKPNEKTMPVYWVVLRDVMLMKIVWELFRDMLYPTTRGGRGFKRITREADKPARLAAARVFAMTMQMGGIAGT